MKKRLFLSQGLGILLMCGVMFGVVNGSPARADDAPVSAPQVVAPAQPAAAQTQVVTGGAAPAQAPAASPSPFGMAVPFLVMIGIMYFLMIRPQQKRMKEHQSLVGGLKNGDEIVTSAGILGTIVGMTDKVVTLEVSRDVQLKVLRSQVNQVVKGPIQDIRAN